MISAPKSLRLQIGLFGRTNVGKSSFLNLVAGQDVAITSPVAGTTTDVVEKSMELLPVGPVVFLDTAGLDDDSQISKLRIRKTLKIFDRADIILLVVEPNLWGEYEEDVIKEARKRGIPFLIIVNKIDILRPEDTFLTHIAKITDKYILCSSIDLCKRDESVNKLKRYIIETGADALLPAPALIGDLIEDNSFVVLIVPIDLEAPKGRLILPQVQTIRDVLDNNCGVYVVKETEYAFALRNMKQYPGLVVCDSQVALKMVSETPDNVQCTTFSILFARYKGDLIEMSKGAAAIDRLKPNDKILIAESCSHHAIEDDIGRVKMPKWFREYLGFDLDIDVCSGRDFPDDIKKYKLIVQCGGCMQTRREILFRIHLAKCAGVAITNYGVCISMLQRVLERVLTPFPEALNAFYEEKGLVKEVR